MPECFTLIHTATQGLARSGHTVASASAFRAGATGLLPLYMFQLWKTRPHPNLPALAAKMRHEKTGDFLLTLIRYAATPIQQSYVLGFISSYIINCTVEPYLTAMSADNAPYGMAGGRHILACSLDSKLYFRDYKTRSIPLHANTPVLITEELAQVAALLRDAMRDVYQRDIPLAVLADAYHTNQLARRMLRSRVGRLALKITNPTTHSTFGPLRYRVQPGKPLLPLPRTWVNPHSQTKLELTYLQLLTLAEQSGAICITTAMQYWLGMLEEEHLANVLGNNDYDTGLPCGKAPDAAISMPPGQTQPAPA